MNISQSFTYKMAAKSTGIDIEQNYRYVTVTQCIGPVAAKLVNGPWCKKNRWPPAHTGKNFTKQINRDNKH